MNGLNNTSSVDLCTWLLPPSQLWSFVILSCVSSLLSLVSNLVFLLTVYKTPSLQNVSNYFVCSLSVADLSAGIMVYPLYAAIAVTGTSPSGIWLSQVEKFVWIQTLVSSTFSLALVSLDRYVAVVLPLQYYNVVTEHRCFSAVAAIWIVSCVLGIPAPFLDERGVGLLWLVGGVFSVVFPLVVISYCYFEIFKVVRKQSRQLHNGISVPQRRKLNFQRKASVTTGIIVGLFIVLFTPNFIFAFLYALGKTECKQFAILRPWLWGMLVAYSGSFINPWIYGLRSYEFRKALKRLFIKATPFNLPTSQVEQEAQQVEGSSGIRKTCKVQNYFSQVSELYRT